jgi:hypothetical protein
MRQRMEIGYRAMTAATAADVAPSAQRHVRMSTERASPPQALDTYSVPVEAEEAGARALRFETLGASTRREVQLAAARGELHPDHVVAASSIEWARARLKMRAGAGAATGLALSTVINLFVFSDLPGGGGVAEWWRNRRLGKQILVIAERTGYQTPPWALVSGGRPSKIAVADLVARAGFAVEASDERARPRHGKPLFRSCVPDSGVTR